MDFVSLQGLGLLLGIGLVALSYKKHKKKQHTERKEPTFNTPIQLNTYQRSPHMDPPKEPSKIDKYYKERPHKKSFLYSITSSGNKGALGEQKISSSILAQLDKYKYILHENVTLPTKLGTTQIDHVIISRYGVFIIESKEISGWIFGDAHSKKWTQSFPNRQKNQFQNPLHQNYKHEKILSSYLKLKPDQAIPVVVFSGSGLIKTERIQNVVYHSELVEFIKTHDEEKLTLDEIVQLSKILDIIRYPNTEKTDREHVQNLKAIHARKG